MGVTVFKRAGKLANHLDSVEYQDVGAVYVADNGEMTDEKQRLYDRSYDFDLTVLDLEYDSGLGHSRNQLAMAVDEKFLFIVDSDNILPRHVDVTLLADQLERKPGFGGISGLLFEDGHLYGDCHDLFEADDVLVRDVRESKDLEIVAGAPLLEFDFVPNVTMFRTVCLDDYVWDPEYKIGKEHLDFYVGHLKTTDWSFGVCPEMIVRHDPGGSDEFMEYRTDWNRILASKRYFQEKWGYRQVAWHDTYDFMPTGRKWTVGNNVLRHLPPTGKALSMDAIDYVRRNFW